MIAGHGIVTTVIVLLPKKDLDIVMDLSCFVNQIVKICFNKYERQKLLAHANCGLLLKMYDIFFCWAGFIRITFGFVALK